MGGPSSCTGTKRQIQTAYIVMKMLMWCMDSAGCVNIDDVHSDEYVNVA